MKISEIAVQGRTEVKNEDEKVNQRLKIDFLNFLKLNKSLKYDYWRVEGVSNLELIFIKEKTTYKCILSASTPWFAPSSMIPAHNLNVDSLIWDRTHFVMNIWSNVLFVWNYVTSKVLFCP